MQLVEQKLAALAKEQTDRLDEVEAAIGRRLDGFGAVMDELRRKVGVLEGSGGVESAGLDVMRADLETVRQCVTEMKNSPIGTPRSGKKARAGKRHLKLPVSETVSIRMVDAAPGDAIWKHAIYHDGVKSVINKRKERLRILVQDQVCVVSPYRVSRLKPLDVRATWGNICK